MGYHLLNYFKQHRVGLVVGSLVCTLIAQHLIFREKIKDLEWTISTVALAMQVPSAQASPSPQAIPPATAAFDPFAMAAGSQTTATFEQHVGKGLALLQEGDIDLAADQFKKAAIVRPGDELAAQGVKICEELKTEERARTKKRTPAAVKSIFIHAARRTAVSQKPKNKGKP